MKKVSVVVAVYNHEKYIEKAINSILMQKGNYEMEVLIGEDCSTDNTRDILKRLEKKCPNSFHFIYREKNIGAEANFVDLYKRMTGDYFIVLEGDDYWTYEYKLQKQVDFLENNMEYIACAHNAIVVGEESEPLQINYPECKDNEYTLDHYRRGILPGQTTTIMYRNYYKDNSIDYSLENYKFSAGDRRKAFYIISQGRVYCIQEKWSCYRYLQKGSSFSSTHRNDYDTLKETVNFYKKMIDFSIEHQNNQAILISEELYYVTYASLLKRKFSMPEVIEFCWSLSKCQHKLDIIKIIGKALWKKR